MGSTGNDIVDLELIDLVRTEQPRFYAKILSPAEQLHYPALKTALPLAHYVWLLWSVKESAYKYFKRLDPVLVFSPARIGVTCISCADKAAATQNSASNNFPLAGRRFRGTVFYADREIYFESVLGNKFISTVISHNADYSNLRWGIKQIAETDVQSQSAAVKTLAQEELKLLFQQLPLSFTKSETGYPELWLEGEKTDIPVSFAHHGRFVAYSCLTA